VLATGGGVGVGVWESARDSVRSGSTGDERIPRDVESEQLPGAEQEKMINTETANTGTHRSHGSDLTGQAFVEWLSRETLRLVEIAHREKTPYLYVDLKNQANAEANAMREYHGRYLFELLQNANDVIIAAADVSLAQG
jgi:hypothetical protein